MLCLCGAAPHDWDGHINVLHFEPQSAMASDVFVKPVLQQYSYYSAVCKYICFHLETRTALEMNKTKKMYFFPFYLKIHVISSKTTLLTLFHHLLR